jgi:ribosomal protein S18 acetylase RimI-like enzyme
MNQNQIKFCADKQVIDLYLLQGLFNLAAFWAKDRKLTDLATAIEFSEPVISVWDRNALIGFARATSDGIYRATIWDVVIHPDYRKQGLGSRLMENLLSHPRMRRVEKIYLMTTYGQNFYQHLGFQENQTTTMVLINPDSALGIGEEAEILSLY